jgi:hypothetical protein
MNRSAVVLPACGSILALGLAATPDYVAERNRWWPHIQTLAADNMEGRNTGSEGHRKAAAYS